MKKFFDLPFLVLLSLLILFAYVFPRFLDWVESRNVFEIQEGK